MLDDSDRNMIPYISSNTVSWKAMREAEIANNEEYIPQLIEFADNEKSKEKRDRAYFLLGHIAKNSQNKNATRYLINRIDKENDKYIISSLLQRIADLEKPLDIDISQVINAVKSPKWLIRHSAIQALKHTKSDLSETTLIQIILNSTDEYDLYYAVTSLATSGSRKSIPFLIKLLSHKKQYVSGGALNTILLISEKTDLPIFIEQLKNGKNKFTALLGVIKYGTANVIPLIINRINELVSKKRKTLVVGDYNKTEIIVAMEFLANFILDSNEPQKIYSVLLTKKHKLLWDIEKQWLEKNKELFEN